MSYPFYCLAATRLTASQHPCRLSIAAAAVAAPFLLINPALAALNCTEQPTCSELGYSKVNVSNCEHYLYCPFDTSYKSCLGEKECEPGKARNVADCGATGADGWRLQVGLHNACLKCLPIACPTGYETLTPDTSVAECGSLKINGYSGDSLCYKCVEGCKEGHARNVDECGSGLGKANGWELIPIEGSECGQCKKKPCPEGQALPGEEENISSLVSAGWSGDERCHKVCKEGTAANVKYCGTTGAAGWTLPNTGTNNCRECQPRKCTKGFPESELNQSTGTFKPWCAGGAFNGSPTERGWKVASGIFAGNEQCYTCSGLTTYCGTNKYYQPLSDTANTEGYKLPYGHLNAEACPNGGINKYYLSSTQTLSGMPGCGYCAKRKCPLDEGKYDTYVEGNKIIGGAPGTECYEPGLDITLYKKASFPGIISGGKPIDPFK